MVAAAAAPPACTACARFLTPRLACFLQAVPSPSAPEPTFGVRVPYLQQVRHIKACVLHTLVPHEACRALCWSRATYSGASELGALHGDIGAGTAAAGAPLGCCGRTHCAARWRVCASCLFGCARHPLWLQRVNTFALWSQKRTADALFHVGVRGSQV